MNKFILDLDQYIPTLDDERVKTIISRDLGRFINERSNFDEEFINHDKVEIIVPEYIYTLGVGFFCGLIGYVFSQVGEQIISNKIKLVNNGEYKANKNYNEAIRILKRQNSKPYQNIPYFNELNSSDVEEGE